MINDMLKQKLSSIIESKGLKLYDVELLRDNDIMIFRISLFKQGGGISLEDCEMISCLVSPMLDVELQDLESYHLEVSSPGIERILKIKSHFLCSIGDKVEIRLQDKSILRGILKHYQNDYIDIETLDTKEIKHIALSDCKKVKTFFEWKDL